MFTVFNDNAEGRTGESEVRSAGRRNARRDKLSGNRKGLQDINRNATERSSGIVSRTCQTTAPEPVADPAAVPHLSADSPDYGQREASVPADKAEAAAAQVTKTTDGLRTLQRSFPHITNCVQDISNYIQGSILRTTYATKQLRVAVLGLGGAGKSTLVEQLAQRDGHRKVIPTPPITPDIGRIELHTPSDALQLSIWDSNGSLEARASWKDHLFLSRPYDAILFVVDCSDLCSLDEARDELASVLDDKRLGKHTPLLVWANKMDVEGSMTESELSDRLALWMRPDCEHRPWCVQGSVMHDRGLGIEHGMKWLYLTLVQKPSKRCTSTEHITVENKKVEKVNPIKQPISAEQHPTAAQQATPSSAVERAIAKLQEVDQQVQQALAAKKAAEKQVEQALAAKRAAEQQLVKAQRSAEAEAAA